MLPADSRHDAPFGRRRRHLSRLIAAGVAVLAAAGIASAAPPSQESPIAASRFAITIDGVQVGTFSKMAEAGTSSRTPSIVLSSGTSRQELWAWHEAVLQGNMAAARRSAVVVAYDGKGRPVARYVLTNAWPSKVKVGSGTSQDLAAAKKKAASGGSVAMETLTLTCEHIQRVAP
jgi:phage tail-like protein